MSLTALDILVIVVYMGSLSLIGVHFSKQQIDRSEYFLGSRNVHWFLAGGSTLATLLSTISYLMAPGEMIRYGIGFFVGLLILPLVAPVVNRVLIPMLRQLPITSGYQYLQHRFGGQISLLASAAFVFRTLIWMGLIIYTASFAFAEMTGFNILLTTILIGSITTFYTSVGGLRTVIWTDNLQLWILFGGAVAIPVFVGFQLHSGPAGWWEVFSQAGRTEIRTFSFDFTVRITMVGVMAANFFWSICTQGGDQVAIQRYLSTPSVKTARRSIWFFVIADTILMAFLMLCGLALFAFYAQKSGLPVATFQEQIAPEADQIMPRFIVDELPSGISGLLLAALLAAAMSSLSSGINSISGVVMSDWAERIPYLKDNPSLRPDKIIALAAGLIGIGAALAIATGVQQTEWNLLELTGRINHIFVGPIAVLFFGGIFFPRAGKGSALQAFLLATLVSLFICFGKGWFGLEKSISFMWVVPIPFLVGLLFLALFSYIPSLSNKSSRRR